jgi:Transposase
VPRRYTAEFRRKVLDLVAAGRPVAQVAHDLEISAQVIYTWRRQQLIDSGQVPGHHQHRSRGAGGRAEAHRRAGKRAGDPPPGRGAARVSVGAAGQANSFSTMPAVSADGRFVAFVSGASNLVPGDTNGRQDVFVRDRLLGRAPTTTRRR